jgi:hypothetical protein
VELLSEVFRVNHVAAANAIAMTNKVIGLKSASIMPATIALTPVAWLVSTLAPPLTPPRTIEMNSKMTNPTNEKNIPRPIALAARMFYS